MAMSDGAVDLNPTLGLYIPAGKPKRILNAAQIRAALEALDLRERLVFRMAVFDGMRPGEILAIRLRAISERSILIDQRVYRGDIDSPKGRKGKPTNRTVALSPSTLEDLEAWISQFEGRPDEAFLFQSKRLDRPVGRDNLWRRNMRPKLEQIGLEWATFQVLRRTNASLGRKALIDDKVAADQRGHGLGVSLEVYQSAISNRRSKRYEELNPR